MVKTYDLKYAYSKSEPIVLPDIQVKAGEALLIYGESGCGKTTFLHLLAGLRRPTGGQIFIEDNNTTNMSFSQIDRYRGQNIGIVYQQPYFIESLSIWDNLVLSPFATSKKKARAISKRLHIDDLLTRYPNQLSTGQQQRAGIARAVMNSPKLILADEPTSNLDNKNCTHVINLLLEESRNNNAALIIVTHDDRLRSEIGNCIDLKTAVNKA